MSESTLPTGREARCDHCRRLTSEVGHLVQGCGESPVTICRLPRWIAPSLMAVAAEARLRGTWLRIERGNPRRRRDNDRRGSHEWAALGQSRLVEVR